MEAPSGSIRLLLLLLDHRRSYARPSLWPTRTLKPCQGHGMSRMRTNSVHQNPSKSLRTSLNKLNGPDASALPKNAGKRVPMSCAEICRILFQSSSKTGFAICPVAALLFFTRCYFSDIGLRSLHQTSLGNGRAETRSQHLPTST